MATYMELVNKLLRKVNEVETEQVNFNDAIGVTAAAKDAIIDALDAVYNIKYKWPWMLRNETGIIANLASTIPYPTDAASIDWNSFVLIPSPADSFRGQWLQPMNQDEYWQYGFVEDQIKANSAGGNATGDLPRYIITGIARNTGSVKSIAISPYNLSGFDINITYRYFRKPVRPIAYNDVIDLPDEWQYVLMAKALYYMYLFYDNNERAAACDAEFQSGIKDMVTQLLTNDVQYVYSGMLGQVSPNTHGSKYLR